MTENTVQTHQEIYAAFYKWLCEQPLWLQDAAWRIYNNRIITDAQIEIYADMCLKEVEKETIKINSLKEIDIVPQKRDTIVFINELYDIHGVNALSPEAKLSFEPSGVTVIYGLNGAGKSGYMRIFKQVCNHPCAEIIQPNVFKKNSDSEPSCKFNITSNNETLNVFCRLANNEQTILKQCDAFDTRISTSYLVNKNNVSYEPFVFTVLSKISELAGKIDNCIQTKISALNLSNPTLPDEFSVCVSLNWYKEFSHKTKIPEKYFSWTGDNETQLVELEKLNNEEQITQKLKLLKIELENLKSAEVEFKKINKFYEDEYGHLLNNAYKEYKSAESKLKFAELAFYDSATEEDKISITSSEWKELWFIAKKYYESVLQDSLKKEYASVDSICPLCHQHLNGDVHRRFVSVDDYISGECVQDFQNKQQAINDILNTLCNISCGNSTLKTLLLHSFDEKEATEMCDTYYSFTKLKDKSNIDDKYELCEKISVKDILSKITDRANELSKELEELSKLIATEEQKKLNSLITELRAHKWVYDHLDEIQAALIDAKMMLKYNEAKKLTKTNKITNESNVLANALITEAYIQRFSDELKRLAKNIKVKIQKGQSIKGKTPYQVVLETEQETKSKTIDILSEGEQRIVALAAFFADATGRNECTPIVIDDPISSLDSIYEQKATKRIAELAKNRQVIVFTHRISFLVGLIDECKNIGIECSERYIRSAYSGKGIADFDNVYHGKLSNQLDGLIKDLRTNMNRDPDSQDYINCKDKTCQQFRICVERAVEEVLLYGIVKRFDKRIITNGKLEKLLKIEEKDCKIIDSMMTKYSYNEHSQATDGPNIDFDIEEIIVDISNFQKWIKAYNKK